VGGDWGDQHQQGLRGQRAQPIHHVGANTLTYDGNGNLAGDGFWSYGYDLDNRLKTATATGFSASLAYDGVGRLRQTRSAGW